jgi:D-alanyl-D-alanine carboxypeptidase
MKDGKIDEEAMTKDDAVSFKVAPAAGNTERLQFHISAEDNKVAKVTMAWEKVMVSFMVDTQVDQKMEGFKGVF